jgi:cyclohexanecarboxylate-CoA ligase
MSAGPDMNVYESRPTESATDQALLWPYVLANAQRDPQGTALVHTGGRVSFADLVADANALARGLECLGIGAGDVVSYQLPNWLETCVLVLALMRLGAVANPIVPIFRRKELSFILKESRSKALFVPIRYREFDYFGLAQELSRESALKIVTCRGEQPHTPSLASLLEQYRGQSPLCALPDPDADAFLIYTSGTVGNPKGVRHSQRTLITEALSLRSVNRLSAGNVGLLPSPLTHITGVMYGNFLPAVSAGTLCLMDLWTPSGAARLIESERCQWLIGATPFLQGLVSDPEVRRYDLSSLQLVRCGGADVSPKLIRDARALGITAVRTYGSTEHPGISGIAAQDAEKSALTDGKVHDHIEIRIVDPEHESRILPLGQVGEIHSRGPELFLGYQDPSLNADAFTADGWFRTGDLGFLDAQRYLTIVGRRKDIIIRKGENISAKEVEDALIELPSLERVAVIGVPDPERGEMVVAVCVAKPGASVSLADLTAHLKRCGMARQKYPERIELLDQLPMTAAGKVRKVEIRARFAAKAAEAP